MSESINRRILVIDDQEAIHQDFEKILASNAAAPEPAGSARSAFFGEVGAGARSHGPRFELDHARQGDEGLSRLEQALRAGRPYALAFVDVRMPPGPDGLRTIQGLWSQDPSLQVVICTAYSDYSFEEIIGALGETDRLLILKKPFDPVEVRQLAAALTAKWNVTTRERAERAELARAGDEARRHAAEMEVLNRQLTEANQRAEAASRAKSDFLANMSHEVRTPMNALLGYVDLLCDPSCQSDERAKYLETVRQSCEHLLTILNDILDISRIEASRLVINRTDFSPYDLAREVGQLLLTQAQAKDLDLSLEVATPIPAVMESDMVRVRQILLNLVGNALKFTAQGSVRIVLRLDELERAELRWLCIDVIDTGIGIDPLYLPHVFDAFSQADASSTRTTGGTGLGLAIAKRLALMLGGDIEVRSEPGKGSRFTLRLFAGELKPSQLERYESRALELGSEPRGAARGEAASFRGRVLVVEDVKFNQVLLTTLLRRAGAECEVAENGSHGVELALDAERAGRPFDVVLMDMQMPVLDGYEAARRLRKRGYRRPIVALTAHAMSDDRQRCLDAGCDEYATKPFDKRSILELCRRLAGTLEPKPALPAPRPSAPSPLSEERKP
jgi:signal transduction histidine kinase